MKPASWIENVTEPTWIGRVEKAPGKLLVSAPQIHPARPFKAIASPSVTMTIVSTGARSTGRMRTRSRRMPPANEIARVTTSAAQYGQSGPFGSSISHQAMKAEKVAISPCAKLITPVER